jgi:polar amino acid transport system substrate-binding protein
LIVNEDSNIDSLREMTGKIMGIESGALQVFNIPEPPDIVIIPYDTAATALENLDQKVIDGVLLDALRAYVWTEGFYAGRLKVVTSPLTDRGLRVVTRNRPEYLQWLNEVNEGLKAVRENGIYDQLLIKWDLIDTEIEKHKK